jgi:hypothetical protein
LNLQRRNYTWRTFPPLPDRPAGQYGYTWTAERAKKVFDKPLYQKLINSSAFQRLADIRFLGAIDYFIHPTGRQFTRRRHTRLEHTLGVAHLALTYSRLTGLSDAEEALVVCAALLHDIGHAPLSHSIEGAFKKHFGINHHIASAQIISGTFPMHVRDLGIESILMTFGLDANKIISLIAGDLYESSHNFLFAHPINIDTLEAISRSETYFRAFPTSPTPDVVLTSLIRHMQMEKLDEFWGLKDRVYTLLIQGPLGLYADYAALQYVEKNIDAFSLDDFFLNERGLRKKHPGLFSCLAEARRDLIKEGAASSLPVEIPAQLRRFFIDKAHAPGSANRYKQSKNPVLIEFAGLRQIAIQQLRPPG